MENLDVVSSVFKRALRILYEYSELHVENVLLVTDLEGDALAAYESKVRSFLDIITTHENHRWVTLGKNDYKRWADLKNLIEAHKPALIVSYRLLQEEHEVVKTSLGAYLDTLTQATEVPVLVLPDPKSETSDTALQKTDSVMVVADHMSGDHNLVNYGVHFTSKNGRMTLCQFEDENIFNHYMKIIEKIPEINTEPATEKIREQLLLESRHYIDSAISVLKQKRPDIDYDSVVDICPVLQSYKNLISHYKVDLLIFNSKDESQLAMHSLGYSLAVEFKETPLLLI